MTLGEVVRQYRLSNSMSLSDFAKASGLSRSYISFLEHGNVPGRDGDIVPSIETLQKCAKAMGLKTERLVNMVDDAKASVDTVVWTAAEREEIDNFCKYLLWKRDNA